MEWILKPQTQPTVLLQSHLSPLLNNHAAQKTGLQELRKAAWIRGKASGSCHTKAPLSPDRILSVCLTFPFRPQAQRLSIVSVKARNDPSMLCLAGPVIRNTWLRWTADRCTEEGSCFQQAALTVGKVTLGRPPTIPTAIPVMCRSPFPLCVVPHSNCYFPLNLWFQLRVRLVQERRILAWQNSLL